MMVEQAGLGEVDTVSLGKWLGALDDFRNWLVRNVA
jgi:hypothetical protein